MDLKKAFDSVHHAGLLHKLRFYGGKGLKNWIVSRITCLIDSNAWNMTALNLICVMW